MMSYVKVTFVLLSLSVPLLSFGAIEVTDRGVERGVKSVEDSINKARDRLSQDISDIGQAIANAIVNQTNAQTAREEALRVERNNLATSLYRQQEKLKATLSHDKRVSRVTKTTCGQVVNYQTHAITRRAVTNATVAAVEEKKRDARRLADITEDGLVANSVYNSVSNLSEADGGVIDASYLALPRSDKPSLDLQESVDLSSRLKHILAPAGAERGEENSSTHQSAERDVRAGRQLVLETILGRQISKNTKLVELTDSQAKLIQATTGAASLEKLTSERGIQRYFNTVRMENPEWLKNATSDGSELFFNQEKLLILAQGLRNQDALIDQNDDIILILGLMYSRLLEMEGDALPSPASGYGTKQKGNNDG